LLTRMMQIGTKTITIQNVDSKIIIYIYTHTKDIIIFKIIHVI
jgi:hypothetical protein